MNVTLAKIPSPLVLAALSKSCGTEFAVADGANAIRAPTTELPSVDFQVGPAKWVPAALHDESKSVASGALSVQEYVVPASAPASDVVAAHV
jgi:hypothetical protein